MNIKKLKNNYGEYLDGPLIIYPNIYEDERGYFYESWNKRNYDNIFEREVEFVQDNQSCSNYGVFRGLHFQLNPFPQGKLVRVISGKVFDVIVDLRSKSKTYKSWSSLYLEKQSNIQLWIPEGFAHGFLTLKDQSILSYKTTSYWKKNLERSLNPFDKEIGIVFPELNLINSEPLMSFKDKNASLLIDLEKNGEIF